jgi:hypothetical protein
MGEMSWRRLKPQYNCFDEGSIEATAESRHEWRHSLRALVPEPAEVTARVIAV